MTLAQLRALRALASPNRSLTTATHNGATSITWHGDGKWDASYEWDNKPTANFIVAAFTHWDTMMALLEEAYDTETLTARLSAARHKDSPPAVRRGLPGLPDKGSV